METIKVNTDKIKESQARRAKIQKCIAELLKLHEELLQEELRIFKHDEAL